MAERREEGDSRLTARSKAETAFLVGVFVGVGTLTAHEMRARFKMTAADKTAFIEMSERHGYQIDHTTLREVLSELVGTGMLLAEAPLA